MHDTLRFVAQELRDSQLTIRIPRRLRAAIDARAERERRSVADVLNNLIEESFPTSSMKKRAQRR